jgi:soluble lytic murein transglycosylase-like protein
LLVHAVIQTESNYNPFALSPKGAQGLMQLMPATARRFGVRNTFDIQQNLRGGASYLKHLLELFGDRELALAAYNAGEEAVIRHRGIPPYPETRDYVRRVAGRYAEARSAARANEPAGAPPAGQPEHRRLEYYFDAQGNLHVATK